MAASLAEGEAIQFDVMKKNVADNGVQILYCNDEMLNLFESTWNSIAEEKSAKDPFFKKVYDDLSSFRSDYDLWEANAFLPRSKR